MNNKNVSDNRMRKKSGGFFYLGLILILIVGMLLIGIHEFSRTHFGYTTIQDIDCSWLSLDKAKERLEESISKTQIEFAINGKNYTTTYETIGVTVNEDNLKQLLESQNFLGKNIFTLEKGIDVNKEKVINFLSSIPEFQEENVTEPQDAHIGYDGTKAVIVKEVMGNKLDYDKACDIVTEKLKEPKPNLTIDLTSAIQLPQVISTDKKLIETCNEINNMVSTVITIKLMDGSTYTIDKELMENWITYDDKNFSFKIEEGVAKFVEDLSEAAENVTTVQIEGTGVGYVTMPAFEERIPKVMKEETTNFILEKLKSGENYTGKPVYDKDPVTENLTSYVEIDITRQRVFMYINGACIVDTLTVTGNSSKGYNTPPGVFYLDDKVYDTVLRGSNSDGSKYASPVLYWMPFYKGYGMHDANWRDEFGGTIYQYNGSHGCVNLPTSRAKKIYSNITYDMPIFIYES